MRRKIKTNVKRAVKNGEQSVVEAMRTSSVRTQVYEIQDPSERLVATVGACMFNEPRFYSSDPHIRRDETGTIIGHVYDTEDFDENAQMIINTAMEIAESDSPKDLVAIAHWARTDLRMRTIPQVLLAVAAEHSQTKPFVRAYCSKVVNRADELKQVFTAYRSLYGTNRSLPNSLKRGLADCFAKFRESDFLKYEGQKRPTFGDVLKMVDRRKDYPLSKAMHTYLSTGEITDPTATPVIAARKELHKLKEFDAVAKDLAKKSFATWETLCSQFGNFAEMWEYLIENNRLPPMAMMRNLRNMAKAGVSTGHLHVVAQKMIEKAVGSKQLPFRYMAAKQALTTTEDSMGYLRRRTPNEREKVLLKGVYGAADEITKTLAPIPGDTLVVVDNSGSMSHKISERSKISYNQAACMLGAMAIKRSGPGSVCGAFGSTWETCPVAKGHSVIQIADNIGALQVGHATNLEAVLAWAIKTKKKFDRIIVFSDMQTYGGSASYGSFGGFGGRQRINKSTEELLKDYRRVVNPDCKLHSIDLAGSGTSLTAQGDTQTNLVSGFSEKLLDTVMAFEGLLTVTDDDGEETEVFTLEYIRENF